MMWLHIIIMLHYTFDTSLTFSLPLLTISLQIGGIEKAFFVKIEKELKLESASKY